MQKKIWIVSEFYYPIVTSTGYYITEIAEYVASKGRDVNVITTNSKYNESKNYQFRRFEDRNNVKIERVIGKEIDKNNFFKRTLRLSVSSLKLFLTLTKRVKKGDVIMVVTNPAFIVLLMPIVSTLKNVKYILLVHDIFPENLVAVGKIKQTSLKYKFLKKLFDKGYCKADKCISIGRDMTDVISTKTGNKKNIIFIPNWSDNQEVFPIDKTQTDFYQKNNLNRFDFIFQFAGNLGHAQGLDNILKAIEMIENKKICFVFIGGGAKEDEIKKVAKVKSNVVHVGFLDRCLQNDFLNSCDVAIVTLSDGMYGLGVPSKAYNIMATGKPILYVGDENSEIALCVKNCGLGWVVEPNNPTALKNCINHIYDQRNNLSEISVNSRMASEKIFAKEIILEEYDSLFCKQ